MKKVLFWIVLLIALIAGIVLTPIGQRLVLLPAANLYLRWSVPEHRIVLDRLHPSLNRLESNGTVDGSIRFQVAGPVRWIPLRFDLGYRIHARDLTLQNHRYPLRLDLRGRASGTPKKIAVRGKGTGFDATLAYRFLLQGQKIRGVRATMQGAQIAQLLVLAGVPPYAGGRLDLNVNLAKIEGTRPQGSLTFVVHDGLLNSRVLAKMLHRPLGEDQPYRLEGTFRMDDALLRGEAKLESKLLTLQIRKFRADPSLRIFKSDFDVQIPELSRWRQISDVALYGPMQTQGELYYDRAKALLQIKGQSASLGGETRYLYDGSALAIDLKGTRIEQILALVGGPDLVESGSVEGKIRMSDLAHMKGSYRLRAQGKLNRDEVRKIAGVDLAQEGDFRLQSEGRLDGKALDASVAYRSALGTLTVPKLHYAILGKSLEGTYRLSLPDLSKFIASPKKHKLPFALQGKIQYLGMKKLWALTGGSDSFGGKAAFVYGGDRLKIQLKKVNPSTLMRLAGVPSYLGGSTLDGMLKISDLTQKKGSFTLALAGAANRGVWKKSFGFDPGKGFRLRADTQGTLDGDRIRAEGALKSSWGSLRLKPMLYKISSKSFQSSYLLKIPKLEALRPVTKKLYHGPLQSAGDLRWEGGKLTLTGAGKEWGGAFAFRMENERIIAKAKALEMISLLKTLGYPQWMDGRAGGSLDYSFATQRGVVKAQILQSHLMPGVLTRAASLLLKYDLSKELFSKSLLEAKMEKEQAIFDFSARSPRLLLTIKKGKIDRKRQQIDALLSIDDRGHLYKIKIRGPLAHPSVVPLMTQALEKKITKILHKKGLDKKIDKVIPKESKSGGNPIGNLIHNLF